MLARVRFFSPTFLLISVNFFGWSLWWSFVTITLVLSSLIMMMFSYSLLRGPLRLCPAHLLITSFDLCACVQSHLSLHLLQQGGQQLINWLKRLGVAFLCQRYVVKHVMMRNGAVNLKTKDQIWHSTIKIFRGSDKIWKLSHTPEQSRCRYWPAAPCCCPSRTLPRWSSLDCFVLSRGRPGLRGVRGSEITRYRDYTEDTWCVIFTKSTRKAWGCLLRIKEQIAWIPSVIVSGLSP